MKNADDLWRTGQPREAGRILLSGLSSAQRVQCAQRILAFIARDGKVPAEIPELVAASRERSKWSDAKELFESLRRKLLKDENQEGADVLLVGEYAAKVIYNESIAGGLPGYDSTCGEWMVDCFYNVVSKAGRKERLDEAWNELLEGASS
jgi:hypothetical protein